MLIIWQIIYNVFIIMMCIKLYLYVFMGFMKINFSWLSIHFVGFIGGGNRYVLSIVRLTLWMQRNAEVKTKQSLKYFNAFR